MNLDDEAKLENFDRISRELLGATPFRPEDVKDPFGLVVKFWTPEGVSAHLREKFSWPTLRLLKEFDGIPPAPSQLVAAVLAELNQFVNEGPCLYDKRLFALVELTDEARRLLNGATQKLDEIRLNRLLLEAVYWPAIARSNGYEQKYAILLRHAGRLLAGKLIRGEIGGEADITPRDVVNEAIGRLLEGEAFWQPEKSKLITFTCLVMRSYVDHELSKSGNKCVERISRPQRANDDAPAAEDETHFSDAGRGRKACELEAEFAEVVERFPVDSLERRALELIGRGKGNEKLPEVAAALGVSVKEVRRAHANIAQVLIGLKYFKRPSR